MLSLYRRLIGLRRAEPALAVGRWTAAEAAGNLIVYEREHAGRRLLVLLNLGHSPCEFRMDGPRAGGTVLLSTHLDREGAVGRTVTLRADEGVIVALA